MGSAWLSLGSLILGQVAWILPLSNLARSNKKEGGKRGGVLSLLSLSACGISLCMQIFYTEHLVDKGDWSALMDTAHATTTAATVLLVVTIVLNMVSWLVGIDTGPSESR